MVYVALAGGIGNQMFQYAFARRLSIEYGQDIVIDLTTLNKDPIRTYKLGACHLPAEHVTVTETPAFRKWNRDSNFCLKILLKLFPDAMKERLKKKNIFVYLRSDYTEIMPNPDFPDICLYGWWQSERYFGAYRDLIKKELKIRPGKLLEEEAGIIKGNRDSVCVHCRKGDYKLKKNQRYQVCDIRYYRKAIEKMRKMLNHPVFYIFSDGIEEVKTELGKAPDFIFMDKNYTDTDELGLMCACSHFIISNSSFSWWAQYLGGGADKLVIAPKIWTNDGRRIDIYLDDWILL